MKRIFLSLFILSSCGEFRDEETPTELVYAVQKGGVVTCSQQGTVVVCSNQNITFSVDTASNVGRYELTEN